MGYGSLFPALPSSFASNRLPPFSRKLFCASLSTFRCAQRRQRLPWTFLPSACFNTSPVASSTTRSGFWIGSARLPPLLIADCQRGDLRFQQKFLRLSRRV